MDGLQHRRARHLTPRRERQAQRCRDGLVGQLAEGYVQALRQAGIVIQGGLPAFVGERQRVGQGGVVERLGRGAGDGTRHVGHAVVDDAVDDVGGFGMAGRLGGLRAAALIDGDVDEDRAWAHLGDHCTGDELGRGRARDQDGADDQIGLGDVLFDRVDGGIDRVQRRAELHVEFVEAGQRAVEDGDVGFHAHGHARGIGAGHATADDDDLACGDTRHAAQQNAGTALRFFQAMRADLDGHAAGDFGHRREERQATVLVGDGFVGDAHGTGFHERLGLRTVGGEVQVGEQDLGRAQHATLGELRLLDLHDHVGLGEDLFGGIGDGGTGTDIGVVGKADPGTGLRLDQDVVAVMDEFAHRGRDQADPVFVGLDFLRYADAHRSLPHEAWHRHQRRSSAVAAPAKRPQRCGRTWAAGRFALAVPSPGSMPERVVRHSEGPMSLSRRLVLGSLGVAGLGWSATSARAAGFFRIMTGAPSGTYYPIGTAIAAVIGSPAGGRPCSLGGGCGVEGLTALVQSSKGSVENVEAIEAGNTESGFAQADITFFAANAEGPFEDRPPFQKLRGICSLYEEALHLVVTPASHIQSVRDLRGKSVAIGSPGSGTALTVGRILDAFELDATKVNLVEIDAVEALGRMRDGTLDAFFLIAGAPTEVVAEAVYSLDAQLVRVDGGPIDRMLEKSRFLTRTFIQAGSYAGAYGGPTIGVMALWLVSADVPDELVHGITQAFWHPQSQAFLRNVHPRLIDLDLKRALDGMQVAVHPGAAQFYREQGFVE